MVLTQRDRKILLLLREQGFASFDQIQRRFFKNKQNTSFRLSLLEDNHYVTSANAKEYLLGPNPKANYFPYLQGSGISPKTKIYYLNSVFRRQFSETNRLLKRDLCLHQLLLNEVRFFVEDKVLPNLTELNTQLVLNDPDHKILSDIDISMRKEFTPDLTILSGKNTLSIELERTQKGQNRYQQRFWFYEDSSFTHVLYYYVNESHLKNLLTYAGLCRKFAFAHYLKPSQVISNIYGFLEVNEWITKVQNHYKESPNGKEQKAPRQHDNNII